MTTNFINSELLKDFIFGFYGYGNYDSPYWFIGMEEGGGEKRKEIEHRLSAWQLHNKSELADLPEYSCDAGIKKWFVGKPTLQPTWGKLIHLLKFIEARNVDDIAYQTTYLARAEKESCSCLLELLPLPAKRTKDWKYGMWVQLSQLPYLEKRTMYEKEIRPARIKHLKQMVTDYKPKAVIFYGITNKRHWEHIAGIDLLEENKICRRDGTVFLMVKHPTARGFKNPNGYFGEAGERLSRELKSK